VSVLLVEKAPAKINLTLRVLGRRADGYHLLESLVAFADLADTLSLQPGAETTLDIAGPIAAANRREASGPLVSNGREILVEAGYQPEMAYFECLHELKFIVDLMHREGIRGMRARISETAKWGDISVGPRIVDARVKARMKGVLKDIQRGKFAKDWLGETATGRKRYRNLLDLAARQPIAALADDGVVAVGQPGDHLVDLGRAGGLFGARPAPDCTSARASLPACRASGYGTWA